MQIWPSPKSPSYRITSRVLLLAGIRWEFAAWAHLQGGPSASGKRYVDSKFEVAFSCKFILWPRPVTELWIPCQHISFPKQMDHPVRTWGIGCATAHVRRMGWREKMTHLKYKIQCTVCILDSLIDRWMIHKLCRTNDMTSTWRGRSKSEMGTVAQSSSFWDSEVPLGVHFLYSKACLWLPNHNSGRRPFAWLGLAC